MTSCTCRAERERGQREVLQIYFSHGSSPTSVISNGVTRACPSLLVPEKYTRGGVAVRNNKKKQQIAAGAGADTPPTVCRRPERETQALAYSPGSLNNQRSRNFTIHSRAQQLYPQGRRCEVQSCIFTVSLSGRTRPVLDDVSTWGWRFAFVSADERKRVIWIVWNESCCRLGAGGRVGGGGVALTLTARAGSSCADSWGELIHVQNATGIFLLVLSALLTVLRPLHPHHRDARSHHVCARMYDLLYLIRLYFGPALANPFCHRCVIDLRYDELPLWPQIQQWCIFHLQLHTCLPTPQHSSPVWVYLGFEGLNCVFYWFRTQFSIIFWFVACKTQTSFSGPAPPVPSSWFSQA